MTEVMSARSPIHPLALNRADIEAQLLAHGYLDVATVFYKENVPAGVNFIRFVSPTSEELERFAHMSNPSFVGLEPMFGYKYREDLERTTLVYIFPRLNGIVPADDGTWSETAITVRIEDLAQVSGMTAEACEDFVLKTLQKLVGTPAPPAARPAQIRP